MVMTLTYHIITLGCKVNQYESEVMAELLNAAGYTKAESMIDSDICIVNSCTVTATGDAKNRKTIHRIRRENPDAIVILCGCMPQAFADDLSLLKELSPKNTIVIINKTDSTLYFHKRKIVEKLFHACKRCQNQYCI